MTTTTAPLRRPRKDAAANRAGILQARLRPPWRSTRPPRSTDRPRRRVVTARTVRNFDDRQALLTELIAAGAQRFNAIASSLHEPHPRSLSHA
ncbi:hypothetical protein GCM10023065_31840 [Microbacterium laevaniformans]